MTFPWATSSTPDGTWTTTCTVCGTTHTSPMHSLIYKFRAAHECPNPTEGRP